MNGDVNSKARTMLDKKKYQYIKKLPQFKLKKPLKVKSKTCSNFSIKQDKNHESQLKISNTYTLHCLI